MYWTNYRKLIDFNYSSYNDPGHDATPTLRGDMQLVLEDFHDKVYTSIKSTAGGHEYTHHETWREKFLDCFHWVCLAVVVFEIVINKIRIPLR